MTKLQLIEQLTERWPTLNKKQLEQTVNLFFDSILEALRRGEKIEIRGFGTFHLRQRRSKEGRNPKTGKLVSVAAKKVPFYKCGKELRQLMNAENHPGSLGTTREGG